MMLNNHSKLLRCCWCSGELRHQVDEVIRAKCVECGKMFPYKHGMPVFSHDSGFYWGELDRETVAGLLDPKRSVAFYIRQELPRKDKALAAYLEQYVFDNKRAGWKYWLPLERSGRILDFGCGWGALSLSLAPHCAELWVADAVPERAAITLKRAAEYGYRHLRACATSGWPRLPFADATFDLVVLNGVLEWIPSSIKGDPREIQHRFLREVSRVLQPSGQLALGIDNRFGVGYFMGKREEHTKLKYISLLPRSLARVYHRLMKKEEYRSFTYGRAALARMLKTSGLSELRYLCTYPDYREFDRVLDLDDRQQVAAAFTPRSRIGKIKAFIVRHVGGIKWLSDSFLVIAAKSGSHPKRCFYEQLLDRHVTSAPLRAAGWALERYRLTPAGNVLIQFRPAAGSGSRLLTLPVDEKAGSRLERAVANRRTLQHVLPDAMMPPVTSGVFEKVPYVIEAFFPGTKADDPALAMGEQKARETLTAFQDSVTYARGTFRAETFFGESVTAAFLRECFGPDAIPPALMAFYRKDHETLVGPIHGDFHAGNVLVQPVTGETRLIDWDLADMSGLPLWDALNLWTHSRYEQTRDWTAVFQTACVILLDPANDSWLQSYGQRVALHETDIIIGCLTFPLRQWSNKMRYGDGRGKVITNDLAPVFHELIGAIARMPNQELRKSGRDKCSPF